MKLRRISSLLTFFYKFIIPAIFVVSVATALLRWEWLGGDEFQLLPPAFLAIWIAFTAFELWTAWHIKRVLLDEPNKHLYVSNYRHEISIPFSDIDHITQFALHNPKKITIHLRTPSEFGPKITFLATYEFFGGYFKPHPIIQQLETLATRSNN